MQLSKKQNRYIAESTHRWNFKTGAVRSGKSYVDVAYVVLSRIRAVSGKAGLNVILGVSKESIERNVLQPMREIYGHKLIGLINSRNIAIICGEEVYCLGAEKISQVAKIQGSSIKYCYGDEVAKWHEDVFTMLKSRLDKAYSKFDGSLNPEHPTHWLKGFLDNDKLDIYVQTYTIFDNPFLPSDYVDNLCKEYDGTIWYDRLILGLWKRADGAIYKKYANSKESFKCEIVDEYTDSDVKQFRKRDIERIEIGLDFGGNQSGHAIVAKGYTSNYKEVIALQSTRIMAKNENDIIDSNKLDEYVIQFVKEIMHKYATNNLYALYYDNAESVLGNSIRNAVGKVFPSVAVRPAQKKHINDRINCMIRLMGAERFYITEDCQSLSDALSDAVWDKKKVDTRLDDGTSDIDSLDAFEYSWERDMKYLIQEV